MTIMERNWHGYHFHVNRISQVGQHLSIKWPVDFLADLWGSHLIKLNLYHCHRCSNSWQIALENLLQYMWGRVTVSFDYEFTQIQLLKEEKTT